MFRTIKTASAVGGITILVIIQERNTGEEYNQGIQERNTNKEYRRGIQPRNTGEEYN